MNERQEGNQLLIEFDANEDRKRLIQWSKYLPQKVIKIEHWNEYSKRVKISTIPVSEHIAYWEAEIKTNPL